MIRKISIILSIFAMCAFSVNAATVTGTVRDTGAGGALISGAVVALTTGGGGGATVRDTTGASGVYTFLNVATGTHSISASAAGHTASTAAFFAITVADSTYTRNIVLTPLGAGVTISGVVADSVSGTILAGAIVRLYTGAGAGTLVDSAIQGATGLYSLDSVQPGTYRLVASAAGHTAKTMTGVVAAAVDLSEDFLLAVLPAGITISGVVADSVSGTILAGAIVRLYTGAGAGTLVDSAIQGATGLYSLDSVLPGTYRLVASAAGHTAKTMTGVVVAAVNLTENFQLAGLPAGITISGVVADSVSGTILAGAIVRLYTGAGAGTIVDSAIQGATGLYSLDSVQPGTYRLVASAAGHTAKTITGVVVAAVDLSENFQLVGLPAGIVISGTVHDSVSGSPLAGAIVQLYTGAGAGTRVDSVNVASNGTYSIDSVQPGTYRLVASAAGHTTKTMTGVVVAAVNLTENFLLAAIPGVTISGTVYDSTSGQPLGGAVIQLLKGAVVVDSAIVQPNGLYTMSNVAAGTYSLAAIASDHQTKTIDSVVVASASLTENFLLVVAVGSVVVSAGSRSGMPEFSMSAGHILQLHNFNDEGVVSVYGLSGKLVYRTSVGAHAASVALPNGIARTGGIYLVSISQKNAVYRKQILVP